MNREDMEAFLRQEYGDEIIERGLAGAEEVQAFVEIEARLLDEASHRTEAASTRAELEAAWMTYWAVEAARKVIVQGQSDAIGQTSLTIRQIVDWFATGRPDELYKWLILNYYRWNGWRWKMRPDWRLARLYYRLIVWYFSLWGIDPRGRETVLPGTGLMLRFREYEARRRRRE